MTRLACALLPILLLAGSAPAQPPAPPPPLQPRGLIAKTPRVAPGYVLFTPILSDTIYLLNNDGRVVHRWKTAYSSISLYLLPNGNLLRGARDPEALGFRAGGAGGIVQELDWDGKVVWEWRLSEATRILHHDIEPLPNGNLLAIGWETKSREEALRAGRRPDALPEQGLHPEFVLEVEPVRPEGGKIVWEWHVWDHLVQDHDPKAANHGDPAAHPERLDLNADAGAPALSPEEIEQLKALGYVPEDAEAADIEADFLHMNAVDYHPELDQLALSVPTLGEIWIVDHSTTRAEAAGSKGGRAGKGGDLLYRWGNPSSYGRGAGSPLRLFYQHDVRWIPPGQAGAGNLTIFNNGRNRPEGPWSSVDQIVPPLRPDGTYALADGKPFGPADLAWTYRVPEDRFAPFISGSERLANGNTILCAGTGGVLLEVTPPGEIVWEYRNPFGGDVRLADGSLPQPGLDASPFAVFRASRIPPDHPGLAGRTLAPLDPQPAWAEQATTRRR